MKSGEVTPSLISIIRSKFNKSQPKNVGSKKDVMADDVDDDLSEIMRNLEKGKHSKIIEIYINYYLHKKKTKSICFDQLKHMKFM